MSQNHPPIAMTVALLNAVATFRSYAHLHRQKGTDEGDEKARANDEMAERCSAAIPINQIITEEQLAEQWWFQEIKRIADTPPNTSRVLPIEAAQAAVDFMLHLHRTGKVKKL